MLTTAEEIRNTRNYRMPRKPKKKQLTAPQQIKAAGGGKRPKFRVGSKADRTYNRVTFHSVLEVRFAKMLNMLLRKECPACKGSGERKYRREYVEPIAQAVWSYVDRRLGKDPNRIIKETCKSCKGTGRIGGDVLSWERQVPFDLLAYRTFEKYGKEWSCGIKVGTYKIDFVVEFEKHTEYWEVKGYNEKQGTHPTLTDLSKLKIAIFLANNPEKAKDFKIVDERNLPHGF